MSAASGKFGREPLKHPDPELAAAVERLVGGLPEGTKNQDLIQELVTYSLLAADGSCDRGELKILSATLKDFLQSFRVFGGYRERLKVSIFGSARTPPESPVYQHCKEFAGKLAEAGYMVITGAGPGIMQAGHEGATRDMSFGVNISLPFEAASNPVIEGDPKLVNFKYFFTRKLSFVKESDAIVLYPGGLGTMDEGFESLTLLQTGKCEPLPVLLMDVPGSNYWTNWERYLRENLEARALVSGADRNLFRFTTSHEKAIREIERFYSRYHSLRYVGDYTILRLKVAPSAELLDVLNTRYRDLLASGDFEVMDGPHRAERGESEAVRALPRIGFRFVQRGFGRLRRLIDDINLIGSGGEAVDAPQPQGGHLTMEPEAGGDG